MGTESTNTPPNQEDYKVKATVDESGDLRRDLWGPRLFVRNNESKQSKSPKGSDVKDPVITSPVKAVSSDHNKSVSKEQEASSKEQEAVSKEPEASSKEQEAVSKEQEAIDEVVSAQVQSLNIEEDQKPIDEENIDSTAENSPKDNDDGRIEEVCKTSSELPPHAHEKKVAKKNHVNPPEFSKKTKERHISKTVRKSSASENALHAEEEDGCSSGYSSTTSMKSSSFQPTVAVGPSFVCGDRAAKRKEYYAKLEEKRKAMEAEKMEAEARAKAEHEAALKELRKNLYIKAKPMPSFYKKGAPPKTEPKKIPPTRAKSPKLSQRKSIDSATQGDKQSLCYKLSGGSLDGKRETGHKSDINGMKSGVAKSSKEERQKSRKVNRDAENGVDTDSVDSRVEEWLKYEKSEGENDVSSEVSHELHEGEDVGDMDGF